MRKKTIDLKVGETMQAGPARITLEHKSGQLARLIVQADAEVEINSPKELGKRNQRMSAVHPQKENSNGEHAIRCGATALP